MPNKSIVAVLFAALTVAAMLQHSTGRTPGPPEQHRRQGQRGVLISRLHGGR